MRSRSALTCARLVTPSHSEGLELVYISNDTLSVDISLSHFGEGALPAGSQITWSVQLDGISIKTKTVETAQAVPQGELGLVASLECLLPDVGTSASVPFGGPTLGPKQITITVGFAVGSPSISAPQNSWNATLFPRWVSVASPTKQPVKVTDPALQDHCGFSDCEVSSGDDAGDGPSVYLTATITDALLRRAEAGSIVVLVQSANSDRYFQSERTNFKQACECRVFLSHPTPPLGQLCLLCFCFGVLYILVRLCVCAGGGWWVGGWCCFGRTCETACSCDIVVMS